MVRENEREQNLFQQTWFWFLLIGLILLIMYAITRNLLVLFVAIGFLVFAGIFLVQHNDK